MKHHTKFISASLSCSLKHVSPAGLPGLHCRAGMAFPPTMSSIILHKFCSPRTCLGPGSITLSHSLDHPTPSQPSQAILTSQHLSPGSQFGACTNSGYQLFPPAPNKGWVKGQKPALHLTILQLTYFSNSS